MARGLPRVFNLLILGLILASVVAVALETLSTNKHHADYFRVFEIVCVSVFSVEYLIRLWACTGSHKYTGWRGRLRYLVTPMALIDLVAVLPFFLPMVVTGVDMRILRVVRLTRLFRVFKLGRFSKALRLLTGVVRSKREELLVTMSVMGLSLIVAASLMHFLERKAQPEEFGSIPAAMWWAMATLTTVGYGDVYPVTAAGKLLASVVAIIGIGLFGLPAGILASGFLEALEERKKGAKKGHLVAAPPTAPAPAAPTLTNGGHACPHCGGGLAIQLSVGSSGPGSASGGVAGVGAGPPQSKPLGDSDPGPG
ncbi:ion transporter [Planctomycetota bacterium]|nr:ion transporter [Planctomycetota bacterium]